MPRLDEDDDDDGKAARFVWIKKKKKKKTSLPFVRAILPELTSTVYRSPSYLTPPLEIRLIREPGTGIGSLILKGKTVEILFLFKKEKREVDRKKGRKKKVSKFQKSMLSSSKKKKRH